MTSNIHSTTVVREFSFLDNNKKPVSPKEATNFIGYISDKPVKGSMDKVNTANHSVLIGTKWYPYIPKDLSFLEIIPIKELYGFSHGGCPICVTNDSKWAANQLRTGFTSVRMMFACEEINSVISDIIYDIIDSDGRTYYFAVTGNVYMHVPKNK